MTAIDLCPICGDEACEHSEEERAEAARALIEGREPAFNAGDAPRVSKRAKNAAAKEKQRIADLKALMGMALGRRFMWVLLERCHLYAVSASVVEPDALRTFYNEGERNVGLNYMAALMRHCVDDYALMVKENGGK